MEFTNGVAGSLPHVGLLPRTRITFPCSEPCIGRCLTIYHIVKSSCLHYFSGKRCTSNQRRNTDAIWLPRHIIRNVINVTSKRLVIWLIRIGLVITFSAILGGTLGCGSSSQPDINPEGTDKAIDFTLTTLTGDTITMSDMESTPVVLNFWATSCGYCVKELPYFDDLAKQSGGEIIVVAINVGENTSRIQNFFGDYELSFIVALDKNKEVFSDYSAKYNPRGFIPLTVFIDSDGIIQYVKLGAFRSEDELFSSLHKIL